MASTTSLTLTQYNPYPTATAIDTPTGGTFSANTYSFLLIAWLSEYRNANTIGHPLDAAIPALLEGVVVGANDKISLQWTWPTGIANPLGGFALLRQTAATYTLGNAATICLSSAASYVAGSLRSAIWDAPGAATWTPPAAYPVMTLNPIASPGIAGTEKQLVGIDIAGHAFRQSFPFTAALNPGGTNLLSPYSSLHVPLLRASCTQAQRNTIYTYRDQGTHVLLTDGATSDDKLYQYYYGMIAGVDGFPTNAKGEDADTWGFTLACTGVM